MKCPICGKDVELQKKQVGVDEQGAPVFHQYAVCRDCKKQWDLDKQRVKKAASDTETNAGKAEASAVKAEKEPKEGPSPEGGSKTAAAKKSASGEEKRESKAEVLAAAKPVRRKPSSGQAAPKKAAPENPKKEAVPDDPADSSSLEKKAPRKPSPETKGVRKTGEDRPVAKAPRKPSSTAAASGEKKPRNPETQKASAEKAGGARPASGKRPPAGPASEKASGERPASGKPPVKKRASGGNVKPREEAMSTGTPKKKAVRRGPGPSGSEEQRYGNIPPEKIRVKKEHAVKQGYEDMLSTDPNHKPVKKKRPFPEENVQPVKKERPVPVKQRPDTKASLEDEFDEDDMDYGETPAKFHILRIIFGIISVVAAGFFAYGGFFEGLDNIASGSTVSTGTTFIIFAICMLVSGLLLLIMQNRNTILAFILPMIFYFGAAVFTFLKRQDNKMFLYCAIAAAAAGIVFLVLGIISRNSDGSAGEDEYDDPFEDDYE